MKMRVSSSRNRVFVIAMIGSLAMLAGLLFISRMATHKTTPGRAALNAYRNLPMAFEKNVGQVDSRVNFVTRGSGYEVFLTPDEAVLALSRTEEKPRKALAAASDLSRRADVLRIGLVRPDDSVSVSGVMPLDRKTNYFIGNDPKNWKTGVPSYQRVEYRNIYRGVDLAFYGNQRQLEYDFLVSPGAEPNQIAFSLAGSKDFHVDSRGDLDIAIASGHIRLKKPYIYQVSEGEKRDVPGGYRVENSEVQFAIGDYDRSKTLIIDPVVDYSTYLGGTTTGDFAQGVAVDATGNAFVTGVTYNATFPLSTTPATTVGLGTPDPAITTVGGAFVSEIDPTGTKELYFSYLSGDGGEIVYSIAVDPVPNTTCLNGAVPAVCVYVVGQTFSDNYPVASAVTPYNNTAPTGPAPTTGNAFLSKLNPYLAGSGSLLYSTYLASINAGDVAHGVAVDATQDAYITGLAVAGPGAPPNFPILNGAQTTLANASGNAFLTVLKTTASTNALLYSTYLGGDDANVGTSALGIGDLGAAVVVDSSKIAYIVGTTPSSNFPNLTSTGTFPSIKGWVAAPAGNTIDSAFVAAVNTTVTGANSLIYSTYVGGATSELGNAIALGGSGTVFVTGQTNSANFFTTQTGAAAGQFPSPASTVGIPYITKLNTTATGAPTYSVLLGGSTGDIGNGIQVDGAGNVAIAGLSQSNNFPTTPGAIKPALTGIGVGAAFIAKVNPNVTGRAGLLYGSYFGGGGATIAATNFADVASGLALDATGNAFLAGQTYSTDFPVTSGAFETAMPGGAKSAGFVSKLTLVPALAFSAPCAFDLTASPATSCALSFGTQLFHTASTAQNATITNNTNAAISLTLPVALSGTNSADFAATPVAAGATPACTASLGAGASCNVGVVFTPSAGGSESASATFSYTFNNGSPGAGGNVSTTQTVALAGTGTAPTVGLNPTSLTFGSQPIGVVSAAQTVTVTNSGLGNLVFTVAPAITGDFAIASTTCSTSTPVAVSGGTCTVNVTFTPTATGTRSGTLTLTDNATSSPQTVALTGTGAAAAPVFSVTSTTPVAFGGQLVTSTSAVQVVTVKNTGNANLNLTAAPAIGGTNGSDFAIASGSTCTNGATVAANATCVINLTFTPPAGATGSRSATLTFTDNASGSPHAVTLTGTAWDFSITASTLTLNPGSSGTINVTVTGLGGFTGAVTLSCNASIQQGSCTPQSSPVTATAAGATGTVTIATHGSMVPPASKRTPPISTPQVLLVTLALILLLMLPVAPRFQTRIGLAGAAALLVVVAGCAGPLPTSAGTDPVTITGTSGSVSHSTTTTVTVN